MIKKIITITFITFLLIGIISIIILLHARFTSQTKTKFEVKQSSYNRCINRPSIQVGLRQAEIFSNYNSEEIKDFCRSLSKGLTSSKTNPYWDYHYISQGKISSKYINWEDTFQLSTRKIPCNDTNIKKKNIDIVWVFGGSTIHNDKTSDRRNLVNSICEKLLKKNLKFYNFGMGGFNSEMETIKLLNFYKSQIRDQLPKYAIFYNGYNDSEKIFTNKKFFGLPGDMSFRYAYAKFNPSIAYALVKKGEDIINYISDNNYNFVTKVYWHLFLKKFERETAVNPYLDSIKAKVNEEFNGKLLSSQAYIHDQKILASICMSLKLHCIVILQPLMTHKKFPEKEFEKDYKSWLDKTDRTNLINRFYIEVYAEMKELVNQYYNIIDASQMFSSEKYKDIPIFFDLGHTGFYGDDIIASELKDKLNQLIK